MNKQAFLNLIKNPKNITSKDLNGLEEVIANFPFCQSAHILVAKGSSDKGKMMAEEKIRKAAAYTAERTNLKKVLIKETEIQAVDLHSKPLDIPSIKITLDAPIVSSIQNPVEQTPEIKKLIAEEFKVEPVKQREDLNNKSINENFFSELEENLKRLRSLKEKAAAGHPLSKTKELDISLEIIKPSTPIVIDNFIKQEPKELPFAKNDLRQELVKAHCEGTNLYSSRLDEVLEENSLDQSSESEAEILLNYLSFLEDNKNVALKDKKKTEEIIEKFIQKDPSMPYLNSASLPKEQEDKASQSTQLKGGLISESMANIYTLQGKKDKALEIYKQLMLKNPEKRAYFETQIEKLKLLQ